MRQQIAAGVLAVSMVGGIGSAVAAHKLRSDDSSRTSTSTSTSTRTPDTTETPSRSAGGVTTKPATPKALPIVPVSSMRIIAGAVGPVQVGMSKQTAYGTGYFDADVTVPECDRVDDLVWKTDYKDALDVITSDDGTVKAIGVRKPGPRTRSGLGVGSTYETVQGALGDVKLVEAGYGQAAVFVAEGDAWIGFLFSTTVDAIKGTDPVMLIEVSRGAKPDLMRDGC